MWLFRLHSNLAQWIASPDDKEPICSIFHKFVSNGIEFEIANSYVHLSIDSLRTTFEVPNVFLLIFSSRARHTQKQTSNIRHSVYLIYRMIKTKSTFMIYLFRCQRLKCCCNTILMNTLQCCATSYLACKTHINHRICFHIWLNAKKMWP